jgi:DNA-directed RNA polymerase subunit RPC12/RpoP
MTSGCSKDAAMQSMETDAHGYLCLHCGAKFYTGQRVFLESKCPKCQQDTLVDVIGYWCDRDKHLTIRPRVRGPEGAAVCEKCGRALKNAMVSPREKDLLAWGATKTSPTGAH